MIEPRPAATTQGSLEDRLRFETLVSDLSARFLASPCDQVDTEIVRGLREILEFLQVDRCVLLEFPKDETFARITHAAWGEGIPPVSGEINLAELYPWCYGQLLQGETINLAASDREWLGRLISRREKPENFQSALERQPDDIKVIIQSSEI
jgi:hypothetical protein